MRYRCSHEPLELLDRCLRLATVARPLASLHRDDRYVGRSDPQRDMREGWSVRQAMRKFEYVLVDRYGRRGKAREHRG
jgi:hypothetical protein